MNSRDYYFLKNYDESLPKPPAETFNQILSETYLHPFNWKGRTTRKSFWISILCNAILAMIAVALFGYFLGNENIDLGLKWIDGVVSTVVFIWLFLANLGQTVRRLHDVDYSGYWYWINFTGSGAMFIFYLTLQPSAQRKVKWGKYFFSNKDYPDIPKPKVPVPTVQQIVKEHFFNCFNWNARSTRTSYWVGTAISQAITGITLMTSIFLLTISLVPVWHSTEFREVFGKDFVIEIGIITVFLLIVTFWSIFAQLGHTVRRLHDAGFSGWWWWIGLVPYIGQVLLAFLLFHPTLQREVKWNKYLFDEEDRIR